MYRGSRGVDDNWTPLSDAEKQEGAARDVRAAYLKFRGARGASKPWADYDYVNCHRFPFWIHFGEQRAPRSLFVRPWRAADIEERAASAAYTPHPNNTLDLTYFDPNAGDAHAAWLDFMMTEFAAFRFNYRTRAEVAKRVAWFDALRGDAPGAVVVAARNTSGTAAMPPLRAFDAVARPGFSYKPFDYAAHSGAFNAHNAGGIDGTQPCVAVHARHTDKLFVSFEFFFGKKEKF